MTTTPTSTEQSPRLAFAGALLAAEQDGETSGLPDWVLTLRRTARERYAFLGLPTRRSEEWRYTSLRPLGETNFVLEADAALGEVGDDLGALRPEAGEAARPVPRDAARDARDLARLAPWIAPNDVALVFVDGVLSTAMTRVPSLGAGVSVSTLGSALGERLGSAVFDQELATDDPFVALNLAFLGRVGAHIEIGADADPNRVIHLVHMTSTSHIAAFPRHVISLAPGARASIVESVVGVAEGPYFVGSVTDLNLAAGAKLTHARIQTHGAKGLEFGITRAVIERDATCDAFVFASGGRIVRDAANFVLNDSGASVTFGGLSLSRGSEHIATRTFVDHKVPNATSRQLYKAILTDESRGVFDGMIHVREGAQGSAARQQSRALMLSRKAEFDAKPQLLIDADDVKCSHGAAIGRLRAEELFYLQSRGLPENEARALLALAFAQDALEHLSLPALRVALRARSAEWLAT